MTLYGNSRFHLEKLNIIIIQKEVYYIEYFVSTIISKCYWGGVICGFDIPINVFGKRLSIAHKGTIVVNGRAKVGDNCRIHTCVNIGTLPGSNGLAPNIGDNVYIGPGAKIYGNIKIADNIVIGANAVVGRNFEVPNICIAGSPARQISNMGRFDIEENNRLIEIHRLDSTNLA